MDSTLRLEGEEVSRLHARLLVNSPHCELIDAGSKNGTFINGKRITNQHLYDGDVVQIGKFNLSFMSETAKPHLVWRKGSAHTGPEGTKENIITPPKKTKPKSFFKKPILFILVSIFLISLLTAVSFYYIKLEHKNILQLAERTALYLAEKNKEALYLGEYNSIDLTNLPKEITQITIWDRHNTIRAQKPAIAGATNSLPVDVPNNKPIISRTKDGLEIYAPIYYESTRVGTLRIGYKL